MLRPILVIAAVTGLGPLVGDILERFSLRGDPPQELLSLLTCGPEGLLPRGFGHVTTDGTLRREFRLKWWLDLTGRGGEGIDPGDPAA